MSFLKWCECLWCFLACSSRWAESSTLPDIASDLRSIQSVLGVRPDQHLDFILIRDDMVARQVGALFCTFNSDLHLLYAYMQ